MSFNHTLSWTALTCYSEGLTALQGYGKFAKIRMPHLYCDNCSFNGFGQFPAFSRIQEAIRLDLATAVK